MLSHIQAPLYIATGLHQNLRLVVHRRRSGATSAAAAAAVAAAAADGNTPEGTALAQQRLTRAPSASAAAAAAIHWPPPLEIPQWLEEIQDVPEAFRWESQQGSLRIDESANHPVLLFMARRSQVSTP